MIVLVSDTSILIDLERGGLLEAAFSCGLTMVVPDLLYERELESENGPFLRKLGLGVAVYGLLWILDQMAESGTVSTAQLFEGFARISGHPRCRLPQAEVRARLNTWAPH